MTLWLQFIYSLIYNTMYSFITICMSSNQFLQKDQGSTEAALSWNRWDMLRCFDFSTVPSFHLLTLSPLTTLILNVWLWCKLLYFRTFYCNVSIPCMLACFWKKKKTIASVPFSAFSCRDESHQFCQLVKIKFLHRDNFPLKVVSMSKSLMKAVIRHPGLREVRSWFKVLYDVISEKKCIAFY